MTIINFFDAPNREHWWGELQKNDWISGELLCKFIRENRFFSTLGETSKLLLLTDGEHLVSFCTYAERDDIPATEYTPWAGFVYTYPQYRGRHCAGLLLTHAERLAKEEGHSALYISTGHKGLYEKYGFAYKETLPDVNGNPSNVYIKEL